MLAQTKKLTSGQEMPLVGFGLWKAPAESCADIVYKAIKVGYRLFDGAYDYQNEEEAGNGIRRAIEEKLVRREDVFVTTILWNNTHRNIDLYLIHFPCALKYIEPEKRKYPAWWMDDARTVETDKAPICETWEALEATVDSGIASSISISNASA